MRLPRQPSPQGRFTSPDPLLASGRPAQPQSWNRYSYVLNNPLRFVDPSGLRDRPADREQQEQQQQTQQQQTQQQTQQPQTLSPEVSSAYPLPFGSAYQLRYTFLGIVYRAPQVVTAEGDKVLNGLVEANAPLYLEIHDIKRAQAFSGTGGSSGVSAQFESSGSDMKAGIGLESPTPGDSNARIEQLHRQISDNNRKASAVLSQQQFGDGDQIGPDKAAKLAN